MSLKTFFLIGTTLLTGSLYQFKAQENFTISTDVIGGWSVNDDSVTIDIEIDMARANGSIRIEFDMETIEGKSLLYCSHTYSSLTNKNVVSFPIPLNKKMNSGGNKITFTFYKITTFSAKKRVEFVIYAIDEQKYQMNSTYSKTLNFNPTHFRIFNNFTVQTYGERCDFSNFNSFFDVNNYYILPINCFSFSYESNIGTNLNYKTAELIIVDPIYDFFPYSRGWDMNVQIPITIKRNGSNISFIYANNFYVEPITLTMSLEKRIDYLKTENIYLPVNKKEEIKETKFYLKIEEFGYNKIDLFCYLTYGEINNFFGNCQNSDYCIIGEVK